jgi:replicative DNA helicase
MMDNGMLELQELKTKQYNFTDIVNKVQGDKDKFYESNGLINAVKKYKLGYFEDGYNELVKNYPELKIDDNYANSYQFMLPIFDFDSQVRSFVMALDEWYELSGATMEPILSIKAFRDKIFNDRYILNSDESQKVLFITRDIFDALSIEELNYYSIALNNKDNCTGFLKLIHENYDKVTNKCFILCSGNDNTGVDINARIAKGLQKLNINYKILSYDKYKSVHEFLKSDCDGLKAFLDNIIQETIYEDFSCTYIKDIYTKIKGNKGAKPITTGFTKLDEALGGGLRTGLHVLGAVSSLGKTSFVLNIADNIAFSGQDVLFFSLEMSRFEMITKSLSREMLKLDDVNACSHSDIMSGKATEPLMEVTINKYSAEIGKHIAILEGGFDMGIQEIRSRIDKHIKFRGTKPVVVIDYLQILKAPDIRMSDKQVNDRNITDLKKISRDFDIPIIVISSLNRGSYFGSIDFTSFKETGAIEFTCDTLIGLQIPDIKSKEDKEKLMRMLSGDYRDIELVILKNRNGRPNCRIPYKYYPMYNKFKEEVSQ